MQIYSKSTDYQLLTRLQELRDELRIREPELGAEIELVEGILRGRESHADSTYAKTHTPRAAIALCLDLNGDWKLTKDEIVEKIVQGGYPTSQPKKTGYVINDRINQRLRTGTLTLKNDRVGRPDFGTKDKSAKSKAKS